MINVWLSNNLQSWATNCDSSPCWNRIFCSTSPKFDNNRFCCSDTQAVAGEDKIRHVPIHLSPIYHHHLRNLFYSTFTSSSQLCKLPQITVIIGSGIENSWFARTHLISNLEIRCFNFAWLAEYSARRRANRTLRWSTDDSSFATPHSIESCTLCESSVDRREKNIEKFHQEYH